VAIHLALVAALLRWRADDRPVVLPGWFGAGEVVDDAH
jgi:hypothetical protein